MDTERDGVKKSLIESLKSNIAAFLAFILSIILKPFQLVKGLFTTKTAAVADAKAVVKLKVADTKVAKASKVIVSSVDIAAKKYALEKLKEIDNGMILDEMLLWLCFCDKYLLSRSLHLQFCRRSTVSYSVILYSTMVRCSMSWYGIIQYDIVV